MIPDDPEHEGKDPGEQEASAVEEIAANPAEVAGRAETILRGLGLEVEARATEAGETIEVDLHGRDREYLLDRRGDALNALQYLLNRIIYRGRKGKRIHVDSEGFRKVREDEVVEIALRTAEKVKAQGEEQVLSPLNPYERRLVHLALRDVAGIGSESMGDGFLKRIAIFPAEKRGPGEGRNG